MKIAIVSDDQQTIAQHFGSSKGFVIAEIEEGKVSNKEYRPNTFTGHSHGLGQEHEHGQGHGHGADFHTAIVKALSDCKAVISRGMGRRIYSDLVSAGIDAFVVTEADVDKAIQLFIEKELVHNPDITCSHDHDHDHDH